MMDKDLNIMESILDKLVSTDDYRRIHLTHNSTRGIFIPSYGVIFTIPAPRSAFDLLLQNFRAFESGEHVAVVNHGQMMDGADRKSTEQLQEEIVYFLQQYADAIRQLKNQDKVTVIYSNQTIQSSEVSWPSTPVVLPGFTVTTHYKDIDAFREGRVNAEEFSKMLSIRSSDVTQEKQPALAIFINALQTMLHSRSAGTFDLVGPISQIQLNDFGTILSFETNFLSANSFEYYFSTDPEAFLSSGGGRVQAQNPGSGVNVWTRFSQIDTVSTEILKKALRSFEDNILHLITQYAATLDVSQPQASLVLAVKINQLSPQIPSRVVYKVQNKDIRAFAERKLQKDAFLKRINNFRYYHLQ
ncbi:hypothetical protein KC799_10900 [candidate division KSB1 bacterium]|nr:hypothetical protein [candidate division KSB1 bacterium]